MKTSLPAALRAFLMLVPTLGVATAHAVEKTWDGGAGTANWHDAANWSPDGIPAEDDTVAIGAAFTEVVYSSTAGDRTIRSLACDTVLRVTGGTLRVSEGGAIAGRLTMTSGTLVAGIVDGAELVLSGKEHSVASGTLAGVGLRVAPLASLSLASSAIAGALVNDGAVTM
ncbi:MAG: hypothetical protein RIS86_2093, partial [Planctomycetota bacterium]